MLTIIRHLSAVAAAWLVTTLVGALGVDVGPEVIADLAAALTTLGAVLLLALYAALEKALKPLFERMGESKPVKVEPIRIPAGRLDSDILRDLEKRRTPPPPPPPR